MCPYYLDGDLAVPDPKVEGGSVIPVLTARLSMGGHVASVQFSRTVERLIAPASDDLHANARCVLTSPAADAGLSKLNSMPCGS
jgi:hypothetical protein